MESPLSLCLPIIPVTPFVVPSIIDPAVSDRNLVRSVKPLKIMKTIVKIILLIIFTPAKRREQGGATLLTDPQAP
jgi:hypothetical protein